MGKVHRISIENRSGIVTFHKKGKAERVIGAQLKVCKICVHNTIQSYLRTGSIQDCRRKRRPRTTRKSKDKFIVVTSKKNRCLTTPEIRAEVNNQRTKTILLATLKSRLREANLFGLVAVKKPLLKPQNRKKRYE